MKAMKTNLLPVFFMLVCFSNTMLAQYSEPHVVYETPAAGLESFLVLDYNNDGLDDLIFSARSDYGSYIRCLQGGEAGFMEDQEILKTGTTFALKAFDLDSDGDLDLLWNRTVYENNAGQFNAKSELSSPNFSNYIFIDIDGDDSVDIVPGLITQQTTELGYFKNEGNLQFTYNNEEANFPMAEGFLITDLNEDGKLEYYFSNGNLNVFDIENITEIVSVSIPGISQGDNMQLADIDGDGKNEIVSVVNGKLYMTNYLAGEYQSASYNTTLFGSNYVLEDYDQDGVDEVIIYGSGLYEYVDYRDGEFVQDKIVIGPAQPGIFGDIEFANMNGKRVLIQATSDNLLLYDYENDNLTDGDRLFDDFRSVIKIPMFTKDISDLGYGVSYGSTVDILKVDPTNHEVVFSNIEFMSDIASIALVELVDANPVYVLSYTGDSGLYIIDAKNPTIEQMNTPKFQFDNQPIIEFENIDGEASTLIMDGLIVKRLIYNSDYIIEPIAAVANPPRDIVEVDLNHDGLKEIVWISDYTMWYAENTGEGYGPFVKLEAAYFGELMPNAIFFDYDDDGKIEIFNGSQGRISTRELDANFNPEVVLYEDVDDLILIQATDALSDNDYMVWQSNGVSGIVSDLTEYLQDYQSDIEFNTAKHLAGICIKRDLDQDGDQDLLLRNSYYLSIMLNGDSVDTDDIENSTSTILFPNPTNGKFYIEGMSEEKRFNIYDITGRLVHFGNSLEGLATGQYLIEVQAGNTKQMHKVIKL